MTIKAAESAAFIVLLQMGKSYNVPFEEGSS